MSDIARGEVVVVWELRISRKRKEVVLVRLDGGGVSPPGAAHMSIVLESAWTGGGL